MASGSDNHNENDIYDLIKKLGRDLEEMKKPGVEKRNGHVSLGREEYDALIAREESYTELVASNAAAVTRQSELVKTCDSQAKSMSEMLLSIDHLKRISGLQAVLLDMLRDNASKVASLQDLSEFWRQWVIHTSNRVKDGKLSHDEVLKHEPDLFRTWRNWQNSSGKAGRMLAESATMTRAEYTQVSVAEDPSVRLRRQLHDENAQYKARIAQLELELEHLRNGDSPPLKVGVLVPGKPVR